MNMPFGKHRGKDIGDVPSNYLYWLLEQDWMGEKKNWELLEAIEHEIAVRDRSYAHFYE